MIDWRQIYARIEFKTARIYLSCCGPFIKHRERIWKFRETSNIKDLYRNESDKACFFNYAAYSESKDLAKGTISDKIVKDRAYVIAISPGYDGYQRALASMVYQFFDKKTGLGVSVKEQLAKELHKSVIEKFKRRKVYARFKDNIWEVNLAKMESMSSKNKNIKCLLCVMDFFN